MQLEVEELVKHRWHRCRV